MANEEEIAQLRKELTELKALVFKDKYSNLEIFRKQVQFKGNITIGDIDDIEKTGGTAPIADGSHAVSIPIGGGTITIVTKNGLITSIT